MSDLALTRRALTFVASSFLAVNALALVSGVPFRDTDLHPIEWFLTGQQGGDSWRPMNQAYDFVTSPEGRQRTLYEKLFFSPAVKHKGFQYPPTSLLAIAGSRAFGEAYGTAVLESVTWAFIPFTMAITFLVYTRALPRGEEGGRAAAYGVVLAVAATLAFYPAMRAYRNGQAQTWINGLFGAALLAWMLHKPRVSGALVGVMCLIKPQYGVIVLWAALRRHWSFLGGAVVAGACGLMASIAMFGLAAHVDYLRVLGFIAERGESFYPNQSFNGLLNRALGNGLNLDWMEAMPPPHPVVRALTWISSAALLGWALWPRRRDGEQATTSDLAMIAVAATAASPIAWEHHYGILLPVFALILPLLSQRRVWGRATLAVLALAHLLGSHTWRVTDRLADTPANLLQSYILAAAILLLWGLDRLRSGSTSSREEASPVRRFSL